MIAAVLGAACRGLTGPVVEWRCDPRSTAQRIYFANHASHLDVVVIWSALPAALRRRVRPVAGRDYWERTGIRRHLAAHVFRAVLIERQPPESGKSAAAARASIDRIAQAMGDGDSLIVFPEGTRSGSGAVGDFRSGLFHLSRARPNAELIPVYLENLIRILPKGERMPVPMLSRVTFGAPLPGSLDEDKHAFLGRARAALLHLRTAI